MAVLRSDQAQLTFGSEAAPGGYAMNFPSAALSGGEHGILAGAVNAGDTKIIVTLGSGSSAFAINDDVRIGPTVNAAVATDAEAEVRRVVYVEGTTLFLDAPLAFYHISQTDVDKCSGTLVTNAADITIDQVPGVYDTVDVPDMAPTFEPRYFLGTQSKRNFFTVLKGQQAFTGSVGGFVLLNGKALRYPFGKSVTQVSTGTPAAGTAIVAAGAKKGDIFITVSDATTNALNAGQIIGIDVGTATPPNTGAIVGTNAARVYPDVGEVRTVVSKTGNIVRLDYPLSFDHIGGLTTGTASTQQVSKIAASGIVYTHHIFETVDLDTVSWHVHMRDSSETAANDFDRTYFGGLIGSASIAADEGGMLNMSWDGVNFLGMKHNQLAGDRITSANVTPHAGLMHKITSTDVDFPTSNPYFFSQGSVKLFGVEVARVRNFNLTVANGEEPRYYIQRRHGEGRGPTEIREQRREYSMAVTLALPDTQASTATATTLFKEFMSEADYGGDGIRGFNIELVFARTATDKITIRIPDDYDGSAEGGGAATGGNEIGAILRSASHSITGDNPVQVDADILFRNLKIEVMDAIGYYP
jgi:hypothetical protein